MKAEEKAERLRLRRALWTIKKECENCSVCCERPLSSGAGRGLGCSLTENGTCPDRWNIPEPPKEKEEE